MSDKKEPQGWFLRFTIIFLTMTVCCSAVSPTLCGPRQFTCSDGRCIPMAWVCDGTADCSAGLDELANCTSCRERDTFECDNNQCIQRYQVCDGLVDCFDGSDEHNCTKWAGPHVTCSHEEFSCNSSTCVSIVKLCNGEKDCEDSSDEGGRCELQECSIANGGCAHWCHESPRGPLCGCQPGFVKGPGGKNCSDVDECTSGIDICSQICTNTIGNYECSCAEGYHMTSDRRGCIVQEYSLMFLVGQRLFMLHSDDREPSVLLPVPGDGGGMDYDLQEMKLYWADNMRKVIYVAPISSSWSESQIVIQDTGRIDGIAIDWVGKHVYWTDDDKDTIEVARLSGEHRTTLIKTGLDKPREIALDPMNGFMYWTDWGATAKIERSHLDGHNKEILVSSEISWPNGLVLDIPSKRLYWTDGKRQKIESITLNGTHRRSFNLGQRSHPFSIALFGDHVFWTDGLSSTLERADKRNGQNRVVLLHTKNTISNVRVFHPLLRPKAPNPCHYSRCRYMCLLSPHNYTCKCPDSLNSTACTQGNSSTDRATQAHVNTTLSVSSRATHKPTRKIYWNQTNRKSTKTNKRIPPSQKLSEGISINETRRLNASKELILCITELCKMMEACDTQEVLHNHTTFRFLVEVMGNCTCMGYMRGECEVTTAKDKAKSSRGSGFSVHWILFLIVTMILMILVIFLLSIWQKIQEKLAARPRVVYNKELQSIKMTNLPSNDADDYDDDDDSSIYNLPSGYENPVYLASTSGVPYPTSNIPPSTSGLSHSTSGLSLSSSGYVNPGSRPGYTPIGGKSSQNVTTDVNSNEAHQFVNPVYFSPEI